MSLAQWTPTTSIIQTIVELCISGSGLLLCSSSLLYWYPMLLTSLNCALALELEQRCSMSLRHHKYSPWTYARGPSLVTVGVWVFLIPQRGSVVPTEVVSLRAISQFANPACSCESNSVTLRDLYVSSRELRPWIITSLTSWSLTSWWTCILEACRWKKRWGARTSSTTSSQSGC